MVKLKNIVKKDNIISCDYFPENGVESGHLEIDFTNRKTILVTDAVVGDNFYVQHARNALLELAKKTEVPKERNIVWY